MLAIDKEALRKAKSDYKQRSEEMTNLKKGLLSSIDTLREDWKSEAGDAFFAKFDTCKDNLVAYAQVLERMSDNMNLTEGKYSKVFTKVESMHFNG